MAAHRYWALSLFARAGSGNGVSLAEVEMRGTPGGADLCTGGTAGGSFTSGLLPANAFDNSDSTIWYNGATSGNNVRLFYDFGTPVDIVEIFVRNSPAGATSGLPGATYGPAHCRVEWSDDGSAWGVGTPSVVLGDLGNAETRLLTGVSDTSPSSAVLTGPSVTFPLPAPFFGVTAKTLPSPTRLRVLDRFGTRGLSGVVDYITTPAASRIVRAYDKASGILLRETTTAGDGTYSFPDLLGNRDYYVVALDSPPNPASAWDTDISPIVQAT